MLLDHVLYEVESDARMNIPLPDLPPATGPVIETDVIHADLKRLGDEATKLCKVSVVNCRATDDCLPALLTKLTAWRASSVSRRGQDEDAVGG
jgi:hypothetical protein